MEIKAGDIVRIAENASYYNGKTMPAWVKNGQWIVKSVSGDRIVIDRSADGISAINSPVNSSFLTVVNAAQESQQIIQVTEEKKAVQMRASDRCVDMIAGYEGCRLKAYKCPAGVWTIGYGHTAGVKQGDRLESKEEAKQLLLKDIVKYADRVNACVRDGKLVFVPNQNQFDALTSFCYNCGAGNLQKLVAGRTEGQIAEAMLLYNKGGGKVLAGLVRRRQEEHDLFLGLQ